MSRCAKMYTEARRKLHKIGKVCILILGGVCFLDFCPLWFWNRTGLKKKESRQRQKSSHEPYVFMKVCILGMYFFRNTLTVRASLTVREFPGQIASY